MKMQAKDIPDSVILSELAEHQGEWTFWTTQTREQAEKEWLRRAEHLRAQGFHKSLQLNKPSLLYIPADIPIKVYFAKLRALHKRGLIGGCQCGCRGDFEITDKGLALIGRERTKPYSGY